MPMTIDQGDLELSLLRTFLKVARHGSMGRAAAVDAMSQPTMSQRILRLEKIIGRKLFSRSRHGLKLTCHGEQLAAYARRAIDLNEETLARLRQEFVSGPVRLGVSEDVVLGRLAPTLRRFQRTYPGVELKLLVAGPAELECLLAHAELDFMISDATRIAGHRVIEWRSDLAWFASSDLAIDPSRPLPLVLSRNAGAWRDQILDSLRRGGWEWRIVLENASLDTTISAVESELGVSALMRETVRNENIREVKRTLPVLPELSFALSRPSSVPTRAQSLMEMALTASLGSAKEELLPRPAELQVWLSNDRPRAERVAIG